MHVTRFAALAGLCLLVGCPGGGSNNVPGTPEPIPEDPCETADEPCADPVDDAPVTFSVTEEGVLELSSPVVFAAGEKTLAAESDESLGVVRAFLEGKPQITLLRIEAHTSAASGDEYLATDRAMAVAVWLAESGIDCKRLIPVGFPNAQADEVVFVNAEINDNPIGGMEVDGGGDIAGDPCQYL
jgi:OOP family OmpA-OmpF porin